MMVGGGMTAGSAGGSNTELGLGATKVDGLGRKTGHGRKLWPQSCVETTTKPPMTDLEDEVPQAGDPVGHGCHEEEELEHTDEL